MLFHATPRFSRPDIPFAVTVSDGFAAVGTRYRAIVWSSGSASGQSVVSGGWARSEHGTLLMMGVVAGNMIVAVLRIITRPQVSGQMRISALRTAISAFVVLGYAAAAVAQVDQALAQQYFKEAQALCERDGGRLWDVSLCAPMGTPPLEALSPGWHRKITAASDLGQLLSAAAGVTAMPDAAAAAARYDGASVRAAEEERDRAQQAIIAELRRRFVDGPVLVVPRAGSGSIDNRDATVIPGVGTVFRAMSNRGAWGLLDAKDGALVSADGETISVPAPVVVDATTVKGDGWTATIGAGWSVQPGPRPGSFRVVRQ